MQSLLQSSIIHLRPQHWALWALPLCSPPVPATALTPHPEMPLCLKDLLCFSPEWILLFILSFGPCSPAPLPRNPLCNPLQSRVGCSIALHALLYYHFIVL